MAKKNGNEDENHELKIDWANVFNDNGSQKEDEVKEDRNDQFLQDFLQDCDAEQE